MAAKTKACPQCGTTMDFRLGTHECPQCGHTEEGAKQPEAKAAASAGPGFRKEAWHRSTTPTPGQPGQIPPPQSVGTIFTPGTAPSPGMYSGPEASYEPYPTLQIEKTIFFGLQVIGWLVLFIAMIAASSMMGAPSDLGVSMGAVLFGFFIAGVISLGLYWFVLFGDQVWAKYCCGGCILVSLLASIPGMFASVPGEFDMPGMGNAFKLLYGFLTIAFNLWLLWILWRDAQRLQGR